MEDGRYMGATELASWQFGDWTLSVYHFADRVRLYLMRMRDGTNVAEGVGQFLTRQAAERFVEVLGGTLSAPAVYVDGEFARYGWLADDEPEAFDAVVGVRLAQP